VRGDVRDPAQVKAFIDGAAARHGRVDVLYSNAGIFMTPGEIQDIEVNDYLDIMQTNTGGAFFGMKFAIPVMRRQGGGVIINMASVAGHKGFPNTAAYNASKHAIIGMTKAAALANGKHNIRINSISPLAVDTPQLQESFAFQQVTYEKAAPNFTTPRIMTTDEMARAVMFLASDEATSLNGMDLDVSDLLPSARRSGGGYPSRLVERRSRAGGGSGLCADVPHP
jgi:NAD(P)-dependent dehydrogenase (short-subunit alcohol dehydrogenase family)